MFWGLRSRGPLSLVHRLGGAANIADGSWLPTAGGKGSELAESSPASEGPRVSSPTIEGVLIVLLHPVNASMFGPFNVRYFAPPI